MTRMRFLMSDGNLFKALKIWALGKIILVSLLSLTYILTVIVSPDLSDPGLLNVADEDLLDSLDTGVLILAFILLFLFFFIATGGMFLIFLYFQMVKDLEKMSRETSSLFLRNMFRIEMGKLGLNLIAYMLYGQTPGPFFYIVAALISCGSLLILINFKKWAADQVEAEVEDSHWKSFSRATQIWRGGLIMNISCNILAIMLAQILLSWILIFVAVGIANFGLYRAASHFVHH